MTITYELERMQHYLKYLRLISGWSERQLGEYLGVTRQAINNIECSRQKLNKMHYLAILMLFLTRFDSFEDSDEKVKYRRLIYLFLDAPRSKSFDKRIEKVKQEIDEILIEEGPFNGLERIRKEVLV